MGPIVAQLGRAEEATPALARLAAIGYKPARPFPGTGTSGTSGT